MRILSLAFSLSLLVLAVPAAAQNSPPAWTPPTRGLPLMPRVAELSGDWMPAVAVWFRGVDQVSGTPVAGMRADGDPRAGSDRAQFVRFSSGAFPVAVWSDRNGDDRLDLLELFRAGSVVIQLIDGDYDGRANVLRILDASGKLLREERM